MLITDDLLAQAGFLPGQHVFFSIDHRLCRIAITPDHQYMIAGAPVIPQRLKQQTAPTIRRTQHMPGSSFQRKKMFFRTTYTMKPIIAVKQHHQTIFWVRVFGLCTGKPGMVTT
jgi:hypothetical protein